jgi:hypothetical protein
MRTNAAFLAFVTSAVAAFAQTPPADLPVGYFAGRLEEIQALINADKYDEATNGYRALLDLPASKKLVFYDQLVFDYGRVLLMAKNYEEALHAFSQAVNAGYADVTQLTRNPSYDPIRKDPRFDAIVEKARKNLRARRGVVVVKMDSLHIRGDFGQLTFNASNTPRVQDLRARYSLDRIGEKETSGWKRQITIMDWVHRRWKHSVTQAADALDTVFILREAESGKCFRCTEYAIVLADCLQSVGFPARVVRLERAGSSFGAIKVHYVTEVWSDEHEKWIVLDPQNNSYIQREGIPLNAAEVRDLNIEDQVDGVEIMGLPTPWDNLPRDRVSMLDYYYHLVFYDPNSYFFKAGADTQVKQLLHPKEEMDVLFQAGGREETQMTHDYQDIYPTLNAVNIQFNTISSPGNDAIRVRVDLQHSMPWFDRFELRINKKPYEFRSNLFIWDLQPGLNEIEVQAVSFFGIKGKKATLQLEWHDTNGKNAPAATAPPAPAQPQTATPLR